MVDRNARALPVAFNAKNPPPWGRALIRSFSNIGEGEIRFRFSNGSERGLKAAKDGAHAVMNVSRGRTLRRLITRGDIGFAEAYMDGDWNSPDLAKLFEFGMRNLDRLMGGLNGIAPVRFYNFLKHKMRANTRSRAKKNISAHYDLGNAFYAQWLDPTMTYSSAVFENVGMTLEEAQHAKWKRIAESLDLKPGLSILEIGCGWGSFAMFAAREYGCHVTGITLSKEQLDYAKAEVAKSQLSHLIDLKLIDYRDVQGTYDRIVSIEMFEAVGEENWPHYFQVVHDRLKPGGQANIQVITIDDHRFEGYRKTADFIQTYIFPGGMLPSPSALRKAAIARGLQFETMSTFGLSYAETLKRWRETFEEKWAQIAPLGFDERFRRMWNYYLASCEGGFRAGSIDVGQFRLTRA